MLCSIIFKAGKSLDFAGLAVKAASLRDQSSPNMSSLLVVIPFFNFNFLSPFEEQEEVGLIAGKNREACVSNSFFHFRLHHHFS
jgi:hypothetical protein